MNTSTSNLYKNFHSTKNYYETAWRGEIRSQFFSMFVEKNGGQNIVDLGCRDGYLNYTLSVGKRLIGVDIDDVALDLYTKRHLPNKVVTINQDLNEQLQINSGSQDVVIAGELIEHLVVPDNIVSEASRILKNGGIFIGSTPNAFRYDKRIELLMGHDPKTFSDLTHLQYYSYSSISELLKRYFSEAEVFAYKGNKLIKFLPGVMADGFIWKCTKK